MHHQDWFFFSSRMFISHVDTTRQNGLTNCIVIQVICIKAWISLKKKFPLTTSTASTWKSISYCKNKAGTRRHQFPDQPPLFSYPRLGKRERASSQGPPLAGWAQMWSFWTISKFSVTAWLAEENNAIMCLAWIISCPVWWNNVIVSLKLDKNIT